MIKDTIVVDIDGCLNYYPDPLKMWAEVVLNLDQRESKQAIKKKNDFDLLKTTYRHSPILSYLLPREGVREVLEKIKKSGYSITLLTARNPKKNTNIKNTTLSWLEKYHIPFDSVIHTKDKIAYIKQCEDRIFMVVEDDPNFLNSFKKLKTKVVAFENELNTDIKHPHFYTVTSWKEIDSLFRRIKENHYT